MATIAEEILNLKSRISSAYDACESKGATLPEEKTTWNLSSTIESIPSGGGQMPSLWGMPISTYVPYQDSDGVIHSPSYTTRTSLTIDAPNHILKLGDFQTLSWFSGILGTPDKTYSVKPIRSQISAVDFAITSIWNIGSGSSTSYQNGALDSMFQCFQLDRLSVSNLTAREVMGYYGVLSPAYTGGSTYIGDILWGVDAKEVYLPQLNTYEVLKHTLSSSPFSVRLEKFYAPNLSTFNSLATRSFFKNRSNLQSVTLPERVNLHNNPSLTSFMEGCTSMTYVPFKYLSVAWQPDATCMCRGCTNLSAVDLSVDRLDYAYPSTGQWTGAFSNCTKLKTAKITFNTLRDDDLSSSAANDKLSAMFKGDSALERVDFYGIETIGTSTAVQANTCTEIMSGTKSGSQLWFHGLRNIYGFKTSIPTYQKWKTLGCRDLYLPDVSLIDQLYVFSGIGSATTGIHFAASHEAEIRASAGFASKWGAPSTCTIYFDL